MTERPFTREELLPHKHPLRANRAKGKPYLEPRDVERAGRAIEKRARKARKRLEQHRPPSQEPTP